MKSLSALFLFFLFATSAFANKSASDFTKLDDPHVGIFKSSEKSKVGALKLEVAFSNDVYYLISSSNDYGSTKYELTKTFNGCFVAQKIDYQNKVAKFNEAKIEGLPMYCFFKEKLAFGKFRNIIIPDWRTTYYEVNANGSQVQH